LKCVVAAMYSWQHCGTGTLSYRQPRHLVIMDQRNGQQRAFLLDFFNFCWVFQTFPFFCVTLYKTLTCLAQHRPIIREYSCTIAGPDCHLQYTELWGDHQRTSYRGEYVHSNWSSMGEHCNL